MIEPKSDIQKIKTKTIETKEPEKYDWRLKLDKNENIYGASKFAISAFKNFDSELIKFYPSYEKYIAKFAEIYNLNQDKLLFINGSDNALNLIANTYLDKDDKFICYNFFSDKYNNYIISTGANIDFIEYGDKFKIDLDKIKEKLNSNPKICYFSSPDAITGNLIRPSAIRELASNYLNTLFVVDISYLSFVENVVFNDYTDLTEEFSNIIIIKSYASEYALAQFETGIIVSNKENIENLKIISSDYPVGLYSLNCVISAINDTNYIENIRQENAQAREILYNGLLELGYKPIKSESNFILCDFNKHCEFLYNKLKSNGVIVKKFEKGTVVSDFLRITVPKQSGVKYILQLLKPRDVMVLAFEDSLINIEKSYNEALLNTFEHFAQHTTTIDKIKEVKRIKACNSFEAIYSLLLDDYMDVKIDDIKAHFKSIFYDSKVKAENYLIDEDKLLIEEEILRQLTSKYDIVLISLRSKEEILYSLKKFDIEQYFSYIKQIDSDILEISEQLSHKSILAIVSNEELLSLTKNAGLRTIALIEGENNNNSTINNLKHFGSDDIIYGNVNILKYFEIF